MTPLSREIVRTVMLQHTDTVVSFITMAVFSETKVKCVYIY